jgi:hypothetical protein
MTSPQARDQCGGELCPGNEPHHEGAETEALMHVQRQDGHGETDDEEGHEDDGHQRQQRGHHRVCRGPWLG